MTTVHEAISLLRGRSEGEIRSIVLARLEGAEAERWEHMTSGASYGVLVLVSAQTLARRGDALHCGGLG